MTSRETRFRRLVVDHSQRTLGVPCPMDIDLRDGPFNLAEVVGREFDVGRADVLLKAIALRCPRNRHNPRLLYEKPRKRDPGRRRVFFGRDPPKEIDHGPVRLPVFF